MGKGKSSKGGSKKGGEAAAQAKKCTCDHPYQCDCGNRPERPTRGHKWYAETQEWAGKGHKQKGGSGQTAQVAQAAKVTSVGNTTLKQWQKMPTKLLSDLCKKNGKALGKGLPIYRLMNRNVDGAAAGGGGSGGGNKKTYRYRLIIPDNSKKGSSEHDIVLAPSLSVSNEEQAREESALLGLLYLFPTLPHERTLPEPYRATFLAALKNTNGGSGSNNGGGGGGGGAGSKESAGAAAAAAGNAKPKGGVSVDAVSKPAAKPSGGGKGATANTQLAANLPSFHNKSKSRNQTSTGQQGPLLTRAQINEARKVHQREVQARIRKHEAIRNANKPMEVFMSARFRRRIECLLSGNAFVDDEDGGEGELDPADDEEEDVIRSYVLERLLHEGFASSHVLKAYREAVVKVDNTGLDDEQMDKAYEETLQYLCIHLREDQLPIGFDPRGGTLDVVGGKKKETGTGPKQGGDGAATKENGKGKGGNGFDANILQFAEYFGLTPKEAFAIQSSNKAAFTAPSSESEELTVKHAFWKMLGKATSLPSERTCLGNDGTNTITDEDKERNEEAAGNECEALEAIFEPGEFSIEKKGTSTSVAIALPFGESKLSLEVQYTDGMYPDLLPMVFVTTGSSNGNSKKVRSKSYRCGGRVNLNLVQYLSEITPGQEVIFELFGHVQSLLQEEEEGMAASPMGNVSELLSQLKLDSGKGGDTSKTSTNSSPATQSKSNAQQSKSENVKPNQPNGQLSKRHPSKAHRRPRERAGFWNTHPTRTPVAESFPKLSTMLERARKSLPAAKAKTEFLSLMDKANTGGRVVLVTGETGCGKTTQIPQFILERSPKESKIIVAQPRRLAATGVAGRVAQERGESEPGKGSVGYVVRGDSKMCSSTRLMFCTTGVLLRQLQSQNALENISHIVIDEVHERHLDTDVLLAILKKTLASTPNLTVVLMSATMDADRFAKYWGKSTPRMHIPGFTHPVRDFTLEDVLEMTSYIPPKKKKKQQFSRGGGGSYQIQPSFVDGDDGRDDEDGPGDKGSYPTSCAVSLEDRLKRCNENEIDYDLIAVLIKTLLDTKDDDGSILVFLPGAGEIDRAERAIHQIVKGHSITILPLHGGLQPEKQKQVFLPARRGCTKIILATNVAETSITIPDCTIVVDTCKEKQSSFDPINRMPMLLEKFASQDSLKQRRGRAGRVRPGTCYKLISQSLFNKLPEHGEPEIRRCALDQTILSLLFLGLEDGSGEFLRLFLDPPSEQSINSALCSLEKIGALYKEAELSFLSPLGTHLAGIPAPPAVGKMLVMGCLLGCRDMAVAIASGMSAGRSPFLRINSFNNRNQFSKEGADQEREMKNSEILAERAALSKMVGHSDHLMLGKAFLLWQECRGASERKRYCDKLGLAFNSMRDILALTRQLSNSLTTSGFLPSKECNRNESSWRIVRSMLVAALSPSQVVRVQRPSTKYTETVEGSIEKEGKAKELKFFIRGGNSEMGGNHVGRSKGNFNEERVFIHPSSNNFAVGSYSCPWLVYHRLIRTSKAFVSDATECNPYSLLLFGGSMEVQASNGLIVLDDWIRLSANARIGSLIGGMRQKVDELLEQKVADPSLDISGSTEMRLITDLLRHDGV